jgi:hypothetical protein
MDWGMLFKPALWLYAIADPAHAYSFSSWFVVAAFIVGYLPGAPSLRNPHRMSFEAPETVGPDDMLALTSLNMGPASADPSRR